MKTLIGLLLFVLLGIGVNGQQAASPKVIAEIAAAASTSRAVKGSPFSAEAVSESVQTLADGNRIVRSSTSKLYRNSEGRFRQELTGGNGGIAGPMYGFGQGISILDPAGGFRFLIDQNLRTARQINLRPMGELKLKENMSDAEKKELSEKIQTEIRAVAAEAPVAAAKAVREATIVTTMSGLSPGFAIGSGHSKWESHTEQLGVQNIEGVDAEGTRTVTTIPAGDIGNERPIEIVYERWYSRELQLVVMSKQSDPRFGEQTYRITNLVRSEPDPSLFAVPTGYRLVTEPTSVYRLTAPRAETERATTVRAVSTRATKP